MSSTHRKGSPPLARERQFSYFICIMTIRITPAGAGKTLNYLLKIRNDWDHPRLRGKDLALLLELLLAVGSPPLTRERRVNYIIDFICVRITPAHAGKTQREVSLCFTSGEHPRSCGKDFCLPDGGLQKLFVFSGPFLDEPPDYFTAVNALVCTGSAEILPQLLRNPNVKPDFLFFFICHLASLLSYGDHPRSRGKDSLSANPCGGSQGSPPLTRERRRWQ